MCGLLDPSTEEAPTQPRREPKDATRPLPNLQIGSREVRTQAPRLVYQRSRQEVREQLRECQRPDGIRALVIRNPCALAVALEGRPSPALLGLPPRGLGRDREGRGLGIGQGVATAASPRVQTCRRAQHIHDEAKV